MKSNFGKIISNILTVVAAVAAYFAVDYGYKIYAEHEGVGAAEKQMEKLKGDATRNHPELPQMEAFVLEASAYVTELINSEPDKRAKLQLAAIAFMGHYLASTRARVEFCSEHGVSIQLYITEFERIHITELSKSRKLLADMKIQEDNYYEMLKPQINKILVPEMGAIATDSNISLKQLCELLSENGQAMARSLHISKTIPLVYSTLSNEN